MANSVLLVTTYTLNSIFCQERVEFLSESIQVIRRENYCLCRRAYNQIDYKLAERYDMAEHLIGRKVISGKNHPVLNMVEYNYNYSLVTTSSVLWYIPLQVISVNIVSNNYNFLISILIVISFVICQWKQFKDKLLDCKLISLVMMRLTNQISLVNFIIQYKKLSSSFSKSQYSY